MKDKSQISNFLEKFGLSDIESELYLGLVELGPTTVLKLARHTGNKRTTVHVNIENLIKRGLVAQTKKGVRRKILAEPVDRLSYLIDKRELEIEQLREELIDVEDQVRDLMPDDKKSVDVDVKFYEGKENVKNVYLEAMKADEMYSFADLERYYEVFPGTIDLWESSLKKNPKREVWDILVDSPMSREIGLEGGYSRYHVKLLPKSEFFEGFDFADYLILEDSLIIIQLLPKNVKATVISSKSMASTLRALHRTMWQLLPKRK